MTVIIHYDDKIETYRYVNMIEQYNQYIVLHKGYRIIIPINAINKINLSI